MENDIQSYAGFTIGPIYDVMRHSKKTRELWFGSYFFSWYMEKLISELIGNDVEFLTPYTNLDKSDKLIPNNTFGGKYHDRFVAYSSLSPKELYEKIKRANEANLAWFSKMIADSSDSDINKILNIMNGYLQTRFFAIEKEEIEKKDAVGIIDNYLNTMEENFIFAPGKSEKTCQRCKTLPAITDVEFKDKKEDGTIEDKKLMLCPFCFVKFRANHIQKLKEKLNRDKISYPSIMEISAKELFENEKIKDKIPEDEDGDINFEGIKKIIEEYNKDAEEKDKIPVKPFHKYFAIVQADGDNLGNLAKTIENPNELSKRLFDFAEIAENKITEYGGVPIYLGGDDILAFMPVHYKMKNVLDFIQDISEIYMNTVNNKTSEVSKTSEVFTSINNKTSEVSKTSEVFTSISFGVNIAYYKFPLSNALKNAGNLLFGEAKKTKKSAAVCLTKHSGSEISFTLKLESCEFLLFKNLLDDRLNDLITIPRGIHYNLGRFKKMIENIPDKNRLEAFFENNFNESSHEDFKPGIKQVLELLAYYLFAGDILKPFESVMNLLNFIKFLTGEEKE